MERDAGDEADPVAEFEQAYRDATSDEPAPSADLDTRLAALPDEATPPPRRRRRKRGEHERAAGDPGAGGAGVGGQGAGGAGRGAGGSGGRRLGPGTGPLDAPAGGGELGVVLDAIARVEARLDRLESAASEVGSLAMLRTSHQTLGRKVDGHADDLLAVLERIERRLDQLEP